MAVPFRKISKTRRDMRRKTYTNLKIYSKIMSNEKIDREVYRL